MSRKMTKDGVDSKMKEMCMFFALMVVVINEIFDSVMSPDELYFLKNIVYYSK